MSRPVRRPGQGGFTLIEVIVSLTLLSMLVLATLTAMRTLGDTQSRLEEASQRVDEMRMVTGYLKRSLRQAVPLRRIQMGRPLGTYFRGYEQEVTWLAPVQGGQLWGGLHVHRLSLSPDGHLQIQFDAFRERDREPRWEEIESHLLLENVADFSLAYRQPPQIDQAEGDWVPEWEYASSSPTHVRVRLAVDERDWPELVVRLPGGNY